jgi:hypothetical protein
VFIKELLNLLSSSANSFVNSSLSWEGEEDGARRDVAEELLRLSRSRPRPPLTQTLFA